MSLNVDSSYLYTTFIQDCQVRSIFVTMNKGRVVEEVIAS